MTYLGTNFKIAGSNGLGGDAFTRNVTDGQTDRLTTVKVKDQIMYFLVNVSSPKRLDLAAG